MKKQTLLFFVLLLAVVFGCNREEGMETEPTTETFTALQISDDFEFKSTQEINLNIVVVDQVTSLIEVYNGDPNQGGNLIKKGTTGADFSYETLLVLPTTVEDIYVVRQAWNGNVSTEIIPVTSNNISHNFGSANQKSANVVANLVDNGDFENTSYSFLTEINLQSNISSSNLDNWILKTEQNNKPNSYWYYDNSESNYVIQMIDNKTNKETFAYYYIEADPNVQYILEVDGKVINDQGGDDPYMSLQFMSANGQIINDYYQEFTASTWTSKTITETSPANTAYIKVVMATTVGWKGEAWFDNVELIGVPTIADADGDLVPDNMDEYPNDATKAFNSYYPNANDYSCLSFEDLWPSMGDYDFNDLVVNFQYQTVTNGLNEVVELIGRFDIIAVGAATNNGFGVAIDALPATVASVTGNQILGSGVSVASNGLENGHTDQAVIIVCDEINTYTGSGMMNTTAGVNNVDIPLITVTVAFATPQASIGTEPFNPFLFIDQTRGREVHLINKYPTQLANLALLGTADDNSNVLNSKYYKTQNNYPFVIEVPEPLDYPTEKDDIVTAHNYFGTWAESNGNDYQDWYKDKPGYRNTSKVKGNN